MSQSRKTTLLIREPAAAVISHWRDRGYSLQEIVNIGVMAFHLGTAEAREAARDAAYLAGFLPTDDADPS